MLTRLSVVEKRDHLHPHHGVKRKRRKRKEGGKTVAIGNSSDKKSAETEIRPQRSDWQGLFRQGIERGDD